MPVNSNVGTSGRFCNHFIRNLAASIIAEKGNIKFTYGYHDRMNKLGVKLFDGTNTYSTVHMATETSFFNIIKNNEKVNFNISLDGIYAQTPEFSLFLHSHFQKTEEHSPIIAANSFTERYNNNNDVFVHVRLSDAERWNPGFIYYDTALSKLTFDKGFISSDSKGHPIVKRLIEKWGLTLVDKDEVGTIMFGSTCKHIILSHGSFSYVIGLMGFFSDVYYPPNRFNIWCGNIFNLPGWQSIDW